MQMIDVLKRLAELDAQTSARNQNTVAEQTEKVDEIFGKKETEQEKQERLKSEFEKRKAARPENQPKKDDPWGEPGRAPEKRGNMEEDLEAEELSECGMMPPMSQSHSPASISMSADSGSELSTMLKDIMTLAGMQKPEHDHGMSSPMPVGGANGVAVVDIEPMSGPDMDTDEPSVMRSMLDKLNPDMDDEKEVKEYDNTPDPEMHSAPSGNQDPAGSPGAADGRNMMNNPVATPKKEEATFESLMKEYRKFMSESSEEGQLDELSKSTIASYANKKQAELDDVPSMPFKKSPRSKDEIERDAKGMMGALDRLGGKKPTSGDVREEISGEDIVYVSKTKVEDFKDWMESEGFDVPKPIEWTDTHAVFDFRDASNYAKMYADEWNEKRHDDDEDMYENINDILKLSGLK